MDWSDDVAYSVHDLETPSTPATSSPRPCCSREEQTALFELTEARYAPGADRLSWPRPWPGCCPGLLGRRYDGSFAAQAR